MRKKSKPKPKKKNNSRKKKKGSKLNPDIVASEDLDVDDGGDALSSEDEVDEVGLETNGQKEGDF